MEAIMTNVIGAKNVIDAALDTGVSRVIALSTDKAVSPVNLYGATKLCAEKLFVQSNAYSGKDGTLFSCVRYGNVVGSRGSVVPIFLKQRSNGKVTVTDQRMTRFWITLDQAVDFVLKCISLTKGGEVFVPKLLSMRISDMAAALAPDCEVEEIGVQSGEKLHEVLISEDESRQVVELEDMFVVQPAHSWWSERGWEDGRPANDEFVYTSQSNARTLDREELLKMIED